MSDKKMLNIALVGCGRIATNHFDAIAQYPENLRLCAVCDTDADIVQAASKKYDVPGFQNLTALLQQPDIDLVVLCTPSGLHPKQAIQVAESGRHVLTEKPMATRWADGLRMVDACDSAGVRLLVIKQNRLNSTMQLLKNAIDQGRFGRIYMTNVNVFWTRPQAYYDQGMGWRGTWEYDGGAFMNQASHYIDLLHWLIGPVDSVQAMMGTLDRAIEAEDTGVLNLRWRRGTLGSVSVTMLTYPKNYEGSITILGEKGTVKIGGIAVNDIQHWEFSDTQPEDALIKTTNYQTQSVYGFGHSAYYKHVIDYFHGDTAAQVVDGRDGLASLELLIAAYRAARDKTTVYLPLEL